MTLSGRDAVASQSTTSLPRNGSPNPEGFDNKQLNPEVADHERFAGFRVASQVARARLGSRRLATLLSSIALASAISALVVMLVLPSLASELVLRHTIERLPVAERAVTVVVAPERQLTERDLQLIDTRLRKRFAKSPIVPFRALAEFRALATSDGTIYRLGGLQNLATAVRITEGRLPRVCTPKRCELVLIGAQTKPAIREPQPGLVIVGRAVQTDPLPFTGDLALLDNEHLFLSDGTAGLGAFPSLELIRRSYAWVAPIDPTRITRSSVLPLLKSLAAAGTDVDMEGYSVTAPDDSINDALQRSDTSGRSLALPLAQAALLLLGALILISLVLRGPQLVASDRLARRGASKPVIALFNALSSGYIVFSAAILGLCGGILISALIARSNNLSAARVLGSSWNAVITATFIAGVFLAWIVMTSLMRLRDKEAMRESRRLTMPDLLAILAAVLLFATVKRGATTADALTDRSDPLLWILPVVIVVFISSLAPRLIPAQLKVAARLVPARRILDQVALLDGMRKPFRSTTTAIMAATAVAFATFTISYRATLTTSAREQASFAVPFDMRLQVGRELVQPPSLRPEQGWASLAAGTRSTDVLRRSATLRREGSSVDTVDVVGVEPKSIGLVRNWRSDYGPSRPALISALTITQPKEVGTSIPKSARSLTLDLKGAADLTKLSVVLARTDGTWHETVAKTNSSHPTVTLEPKDAGGRFIGIRIAQVDETASRIEHHVQEGYSSVEALNVSLTLRSITAWGSDETNGKRLKVDPATWSGGDATVHPDGSVEIAAAILGSSRLIVPAFDHDPIPALVDPITAATAVDGIVTVDTQGHQFDFQVVGIAKRFPTMSERFIVTDLATLSLGFNLAQPAYGTPIETWLAADSSKHENTLAAALNKSPYVSLLNDRRVDRLNDQRSDPLSRLSLALLTWSTVLATVMMIGALLLNAVAERSDGESFHRALLFEGASESTIRKLVVRRCAALSLAGLPIGLLASALMTTLVVSAVKITADAIVPLPPMRRVVPWTLLIVVVTGFMLLSFLAAAAGARITKRISSNAMLRERT
jgi:hypothetical protein